MDDCPHCYQTVLFKSDGTCPSCGKDPGDFVGGHPEVCTCRIVSRASLPPVCIHCGEPATDTRKLVRGEDGKPSTGRVLATVLLGPLGAVFGGLASGGSKVVRTDLPHCRFCSAKKPEVVSVDFENYQIILKVHRKFRDAVRGAE